MVVNILIADDNIYYAKNLMTYINETSKEIRVCNIAIDGNEVLNFLNDTIDIVLLDLNMPNVNGFVVLEYMSNIDNSELSLDKITWQEILDTLLTKSRSFLQKTIKE